MRLKSAVASDLPSCRHQHQHPQSEVTVWSQTCVAPPTCPTAGGPRQTIPFSSGRWPTHVPYGRGSSRNSRRQCCTKSNVLRGIQTRVAQWRHQTWQLQSCKPEQTYIWNCIEWSKKYRNGMIPLHDCCEFQSALMYLHTQTLVKIQGGCLNLALLGLFFVTLPWSTAG